MACETLFRRNLRPSGMKVLHKHGVPILDTWRVCKVGQAMVDFVFPSKRKGWVYGIRGTVAGAKKWTETHVSSSGGGGHVGPYGGHVSAPTVSSYVVERGEVWITNRHGKDVQIRLNLPAIPGHEVAVLWGDVNGKESAKYLYWANYSSQKHNLLESNVENRLIDANVTFGRIITYGIWFCLVLVPFTKSGIFEPLMVSLYNLIYSYNGPYFGSPGIKAYFWLNAHVLPPLSHDDAGKLFIAGVLFGWVPGRIVRSFIRMFTKRANLKKLKTSLETLSDRNDPSFDG